MERLEEKLCIVTDEVRDPESMNSLCQCDASFHFFFKANK